MDDHVSYKQASAFPGLFLSTARFTAFTFEPHYHLDCHVALVADGVQRQSFQGSSLLLTRGVIQLMPAGEVHDGKAADAPYTLHTFRLSPELLKGIGEEVTGKHCFPSHSAAVIRDAGLATQLLRMHAAMMQAATDPLLGESRVLDLFESLFARLLKPAPKVVAGALSTMQFRLLREFIEAHLPEKILLQDLASLLNLDRFTFLKMFKRTVGMTPHAWLIRLRLERALVLLKARDAMPIVEIAHAVGFFDQSHFTRAFQHAYGVNPSNFT
ncbi:DNA-binding domain-containing protein, AraC-type [Herbaspirillum sp. CF444]|uniref:helix-turn-helix transcriptional regulator n=1 Tax=Herbaspirillum sp. CF444 TaxID=1144319 RepID=UPI0002724B4E|nr:AraC family transcriptional regulator [Herbaspirillum sp. CF444]EJL94345.1 DNA-binding domain-containing protein, AraC-type [Herbaspirillum sp. CF444]